MKISVLIPAYNEEKDIRRIIERTKKAGFNDILVVDDGSSDKTADIAESLGATVIRHKTNKGKGEALKTGFSYLSDRDCVAVIDADMQYNPEEIGKITEPVSRGVDFVMGCRDWKTVPFRHRLGNFVWRTAFNLLFGANLRDTNCGFMALSSRAVKLMKPHGGYIIENSMLATALKNNLKIEQVPVSVNYHNLSKVPRGVRMVLGVLLFIIKEGLKYRIGRLKFQR